MQIKHDKNGWHFRLNRGFGLIVLVAVGSLLANFAPKHLQWLIVGGLIASAFLVGWVLERRGEDKPIRGFVRDSLVAAVAVVDEYAFLAGLGAWAWNPHTWARPWIRLGGALCFLADPAAEYILSRIGSKKKRTLPTGMGGVWTLGLAYAITSPQPHETQPIWLTAIAVASVVLLILVAIPIAVVQYRSRRDEREMAIATRSLSFAFIVTMAVVLAFSMLEGLKVGPTLRLDYIIGVAAASWFASWFVLQRRM